MSIIYCKSCLIIMSKDKVLYFPLQNKLHINVKRNSLLFLCQATSFCRVLKPSSTKGQMQHRTRLSLEEQLHISDGFTPRRVSQSWTSCDTRAALTEWQNETNTTGTDH